MDADTFTAWTAEQPSGFRPEVITAAARRCRIVGLGMDTRESYEIFSAAAETALQLLQEGFTTLALQENPRVVALYDRHVSGEEVDLEQALSQAWGPWQIHEWVHTLERLRALNLERAGQDETQQDQAKQDQTQRLRLIGLAEPRALPQDYDRILHLLRGGSAETPDAVAEVEQILGTIRTAHHSGEHVLRAQGTHPGTPFVELARRARSLAASLAAAVPQPNLQEALELLDGVVTFHAESVEAGHDFAEEERAAAQRLLEHHRHTGERVVMWDGIAHTAADGEHGRVGAHLRSELGQGYLAVLFSFGRGRIPEAEIPAPRSDSLDALLDAAGRELTLDLRGPLPPEVQQVLEQPLPARVISGMYDPTDDAAHYLPLPSVWESFDVLVHRPEVTPVHPL